MYCSIHKKLKAKIVKRKKKQCKNIVLTLFTQYFEIYYKILLEFIQLFLIFIYLKDEKKKTILTNENKS